MDEKVLINAAKRIKAHYARSRVLLFGSSARDETTAESDIDLCIIIDNPEERLLDISRNIRREIYPLIHKPLDILVYDKKTFDERSSLSLTMEAEIAEYAREL